MSGRKSLSAIRSVTVGVILVSVVALSQMPSLARLVVKSSPIGARISIDDKPMGQFTDAVFVVAPGNYRVSVSGSANCGDQAVTLKSGDTRTLFCKGGTWTVQ